MVWNIFKYIKLKLSIEYLKSTINCSETELYCINSMAAWYSHLFLLNVNNSTQSNIQIISIQVIFKPLGYIQNIKIKYTWKL